MTEADYFTREYREDDDVSEERNERGYPGCEQCDGQGEYYFADLEVQRDDLAAALIAIRDEFDLGCEKWCAANGLRPTAEFQVDGMARFVAQEALARLEGDDNAE